MRLAFIGFGEAAQAFVKGWDGAPVRKDLPTLSAFDIKTDLPTSDAARAKRAEYARWSIAGCDSAADALKGASAVFSLVTADQALAAAQGAARHIAPGTLYFDGNSCSPGTKRQAAEAIEAVGGRYVDMAIMAPVHPALHHVPLLLSGSHNDAALDVLSVLDMSAKVAEGPVGKASAIKMMRSVMIKGLEALVVECVLAGRKAGVDDVVLDSLDATFPGFDWKARAAYMMERVMVHGVRRAAEMREVANTVEELGLDGAMATAMATATADLQQRVGDLGLAADSADYEILADRILQALLDADAPAKAVRS